MLIIEGSDLVGKTTLIKALCDETIKRGFPMIPQHFGLLPDNWNFFVDYIGYINSRTVMDRFIMSEVVYGETLRCGCRIDPGYFRALQSILNQSHSMTVIVAAESEFFKEHVRKQYQHRNEVFKEEQICEVNDAFINVLENGCLNEYTLSYDIGHIVNSNRDFPSSNLEFVEEIVEIYLKLQGA